MVVAIKVGNIYDEIGASDFLFAFFSTVVGNLEPAGRGTRFPAITEKLYSGRLAHQDAGAAMAELMQIRKELSLLPVERMIWDINDPGRRPPWGDDISSEITDLSNYFVTSTGRDLIAVLVEAVDDLRTEKGYADIVPF